MCGCKSCRMSLYAYIYKVGLNNPNAFPFKAHFQVQVFFHTTIGIPCYVTPTLLLTFGLFHLVISEIIADHKSDKRFLRDRSTGLLKKMSKCTETFNWVADELGTSNPVFEVYGITTSTVDSTLSFSYA